MNPEKKEQKNNRKFLKKRGKKDKNSKIKFNKTQTPK